MFQRQLITRNRSYISMNILFLGLLFCPHELCLILVGWENTKAFTDWATNTNKRLQKKYFWSQAATTSSACNTWTFTSLPECLLHTASTAAWFSSSNIIIWFSIRIFFQIQVTNFKPLKPSTNIIENKEYSVAFLRMVLCKVFLWVLGLPVYGATEVHST